MYILDLTVMVDVFFYLALSLTIFSCCNEFGHLSAGRHRHYLLYLYLWRETSPNFWYIETSIWVERFNWIQNLLSFVYSWCRYDETDPRMVLMLHVWTSGNTGKMSGGDWQKNWYMFTFYDIVFIRICGYTDQIYILKLRNGHNNVL